MTRPTVEAIGRTALAAAVGGLVMVTVVADRMTPPAGAIADAYSTLAAILITATVLTTVLRRARGWDGQAVSPPSSFCSRPSARRGTARGCGSHEQQFDYLVVQQKTDLELRSVELSGDIVNFLRQRARTAPPRPRPATWDRDEAAVFRHEQETAMLFDAEFGAQKCG